MTTLCITGNHPLTLTRIASQLEQAGMSAAQPLQRDPSVTLQVWHQRVCAQSAGAIKPSRLWEQLAVDLMLANLDAPVWGWADTQSHQLLDFWSQLDSDIRFVLICQTPQQVIARLLTAPLHKDESTLDPERANDPLGHAPVAATNQALADWHSYHQAMLRFHLRHPSQSVMVWAEQAQSSPQALVHHLNQHWNLALTPQDKGDNFCQLSTTAHADGTPNAVIQQLVTHIASLHPELDELNRELHATIALLLALTEPDETGQGDAIAPATAIDVLIDSYHRLADRSSEHAALQAQAEALLQRATETKAKTEALSQRDIEAKAKTTAQGQLKESEKEGELLLLQLHSVQEELEKHFLQNQDTAAQLAALKIKFDTEAKAKTEALTQRDALTADKAQLTANNVTLTKTNTDSAAAHAAETKVKTEALTQRATETKAKTEALTQRDNEAKAKTTAQGQLKESEKEGELLLLQLHSVQEELEKHFLQNQDTAAQLAALKIKFDTETKAKTEALTQRDALTADKVKLTANNVTLTKTNTDSAAAHAAETKAKTEALTQRATEAKAKTEALTQRDNEAKAKTAAQAQLKESEKEGELLLLQLHQVQEELEKYYLQHQQAQREVQTHSDRWSRLLKAQPDLCDFDTVELLADGGEGQPLHWRLNNASLGGRSFNQIEFSMIIEEGVAGFVLHRTASGATPLLRWPASAKADSELTIIPVNGGPLAQRRAAHLVQLCASDWGLMLALPNTLNQALQRGHLAITPARQQDLLKALSRYKSIMESMQGLVRFDAVSLTGQQSAGQRNVLAVKLDKVRYAKHTLASFAFQLQINKNAAGSPDTAHFIFDETTNTAPFQSWATNMLNTVGQSVMAVRLDAHGWVETSHPQLSPDDQGFMSALTDSLAVVLISLQTDGVRTDYPWQDWLKDASLLRQWSRQPRLPIAPVLVPEPVEVSEPLQLPPSPQAAPPAPPAPSTLIALPATPTKKPRKVKAIVEAKAKAKVVVEISAPTPAPTAAPTAKPATKTRRAK